MTDIQTLIGFDFGSKRIGIAVGQTLTRTATPLETITVRNGTPDWQRIRRIIMEWRPVALVVGDPLNMDGTEQDLTAEAGAFADELVERFELPVYRADERLSSWEAKNRLRDTWNLDPVAAQAILETWLSEHAAEVAGDDTIPPGSATNP